MAVNVSVIGRTTRIRGRITGAVDLEVQGFVEGEIAVGGDVTVDAEAMVGAGIRGRRLVVRGAVKGDLIADESVLLEAGARVVGDVRAPRIAIAPGALVRGYVQTGDADAAGPRAARTQAAARPAPASAVRAAPAAIAPVAAAARPAASQASLPQAAASRPVARAPQPAPARVVAPPPPAPPSQSAGLRRPPPPVVPALRSAKGQIAKKKER